jgi:hypothetical protein
VGTVLMAIGISFYHFINSSRLNTSICWLIILSSQSNLFPPRSLNIGSIRCGIKTEKEWSFDFFGIRSFSLMAWLL